MAKKVKPSIPLIILFVILLLLFFLSGVILELVSNWSGHGSFTYSYTGGDEAIVSLEYVIPQELADAMVLEPTTGWDVTVTSNILSITGGTLNPGESVTVSYRLRQYVTGGTKSVTITTTTETGRENTQQTTMHIEELVILAIANILYQNAIWFLILAIIVLVVIIVLYFRDRRKQQVTPAT